MCTPLVKSKSKYTYVMTFQITFENIKKKKKKVRGTRTFNVKLSKNILDQVQ